MRLRTYVALIGVFFLLTACTDITNIDKTFAGVYNWSCNSNQRETATLADWDQAITVTETIKDELYQSGVLSLRVGVPYIIQITNLDREMRSFRAPDLFRSSSVLRVVHDGNEIAAPCLQAVVIPPQKTSEIQLVPLKKGYYNYRETYNTVPVLNLLPIIVPVSSIGFAHVY